MSSWARIGAKCMCIAENGSWVPVGHSDRPAPDFPAFGDVFVIAEVLERPSGVFLGFAEFAEASFSIRCFAPVVEQPNDVALFTHHLDLAGEMA
ncbi:hypothetical protein [Devosia sp. Naph2]|uniref:hypothetical protein n=1 Tax=Devosia polycyclovorans TaxID=3345148 RepID=UPI0035CFE865